MALLSSLWWVAAGVAPAHAETGPTAVAAQTQPARASSQGSFLPDSAILARVEGKAITAGEFVERYFNSFTEEQRTGADSAGRMEFLGRLVDKEVMSQIARNVGRPLSFNDQATLRTHTQRVLSNVLFQRAVQDSVRLEPAEVEAALSPYRWLRLDRLAFRSRKAAESARSRLVSGGLTWEGGGKLAGVVAKDLGWRQRNQIPANVSEALLKLGKGAFSPVLAESSFFTIYRVTDERPAVRSIRQGVTEQLRGAKAQERAERFLRVLRAQMGVTIDTANVRWAASQFPTKYRGGGTSQVVIDVTVPEIAPADTSRVLATSSVGRVTVGRLLDDYKNTADMARPSLDTPAAVVGQIDLILLEPRFEQLARERGLDRDPMAISLIENKRDEIMAEHLYEDSIMAKVFIPPAQRRKYYQQNQHRFVTPPNAVFALFFVNDKQGADSIATLLRAGKSAVDMVREDSLAGRRRSVIRRMRQDEQGKEYHKLVFDELRPGEVAVAGNGAVVQLLERDSGRAVGFEEADAQIDEYMQTEAANELFAAFLKRHKRRMRIEIHPERVMRVRLVDPLDAAVN